MMCTHAFEVWNTGPTEGVNHKQEVTHAGNSGINSEEQGRASDEMSPKGV